MYLLKNQPELERVNGYKVLWKGCMSIVGKRKETNELQKKLGGKSII